MELQEHNRLQRINHLPLELLSHVFVLCDASTDYDVEEQVPRSYIQFAAPAVCRHWRKVALASIALWTTIRIMQPVPCKRTALYLERSGSTVPLDIEVVIFSPQNPGKGDKLENLSTYAERARKTFAFIIKHGGSSSRWRSLGFGTDIFASCSAAMDFFSRVQLPSLENLEVVSMGPWPGHPEDDKMFTDAHRGKTGSKLLFTKPPPQLRSVRLEGVINSHLFGDISRPQLVGLTDIYISFSGRHPGINHIYSMLAASPRLTKLCFNSGDTYPDGDGDTTTTSTPPSPKITLAHLQSLAFMHMLNPVWNLSILQIFKAPALENLELSFWIDPDGSQLLVEYISNQLTQSSPYFPATLNVISFFTVMGETPDPEPLLRAYPNITTLKTESITALLKRPWLVPNLVNLEAEIYDTTELKNLVLGRCGDGLPLKTVEARWSGNGGALSPDDREQIERMVELTVWTRKPFADDEGENSGSQD
ncbi:hypothetical protein ACGC1H_007663 [Rhizoctonia solani]|uniref:F-box domain-containing protein n=1 Tax=Rhizoctonia solani TaxID=456999 RepID=A0A8H3GDX0_9AGAM|nr:unnamed protein product [Rhizoctonia solani]